MISIGVNNGQRLELHQEATDGHIRVDTIDDKGNTTHSYDMSAQDIVSLLNDYIYKESRRV